MADLKTSKNRASVKKFIASVEHETRRKDALTLLDLMSEITGEKPFMYGTSIVGFGHFQMTYESGREVDWFYCGFSPRKASMSLYIMSGFDSYTKLMEKLGKHKTGKSCLYINKLEDVHMPTLKKLIKQSVTYLKKKYG